MMTVMDEGDILNVAVRRDRQRGRDRLFSCGQVCSVWPGCRVYGTVHLEVRESNTTARRLYQRLGFREDGLRKNYYTEPVEAAVLMTKTDNDSALC